MQEALEERKQPEHSAKSNEATCSGNAPERRNRQCDHQEAQRPDTGEIRDIFDRVGAESTGEAFIGKPQRPTDPEHGRKAGQENNWLENPPTIEFRHFWN